MAVEETIAIVGFKSNEGSSFVEKLVHEKFRLLIIPENKDEMLQLKQCYEEKNVSAEVEILNCAKNGCWEADIIAFINPTDLNSELFSRIKEVAVQKIVVAIFETQKMEETTGKAEKLQELLPNSKIVQVLVDVESQKASVVGKNEEAVANISAMLQKAAFKISSVV